MLKVQFLQGTTDFLQYWIAQHRGIKGLGATSGGREGGRGRAPSINHKHP